MSIQQGDQFGVKDGGTIEVTMADMNRVEYKYIHGSSRSGSVSAEVFEQFRTNGYFKEVKA